MQPISYGMSQGYPMYPNCFDQLTTHGVIADDLVGYITDVPSPYLQNYVAQRGWAPSMPGRIMPDPLPNMQPPQRLPRNDVYQTIPPQGPQPYQGNPYMPQKPSNTWRKVALAALVVGLSAFGIWKGKQGINWIKNKFRTPTVPPAPTPQPAPAQNTSLWQKIKNYFC